MPRNETMENLGRLLCSAAYRDARGLQQAIGVHGFRALFEGLDQLCPAWIELLSGGFRCVGFRTNATKPEAGVKWRHLGEVVRPGVWSIDGVGEVRALELLLYYEVAERFVVWADEDCKDDQRSPT